MSTPHVVVAARHHLLQDHLVRVARSVDLSDDGGRLLGGGGGVDLLHAVKGEFPVSHTGRRLHNNRIGKAQLVLGEFGGLRRRGEDFRGGVGNAELVADFVELGLFLDQAVEVGGGLGAIYSGSFGLAADDHRRVVVGAAEEVELLAGVLLGEVVEDLQHGGFVVDVRHDGEVDDLGILGGRHGVPAEGVALHPVGLMEGPGKVVAVQVGTQEYRDQIGVHGKNCISLV